MNIHVFYNLGLFVVVMANEALGYQKKSPIEPNKDKLYKVLNDILGNIIHFHEWDEKIDTITHYRARAWRWLA